MLVLPYIRNISEKINLSIDKNGYLTGHRILIKKINYINYIKLNKINNEFYKKTQRRK